MAYNYETKSYLAYVRGVEFGKAAEILEESDSHVMIPQIVNAAFSCELLLKAVIIAEKKREEAIYEHELSKLFDMMDSKTRNAVRIKSQISDWDVFLKESSNAFAEWRYLHEKDKVMHISVWKLLRFHSALKDHYETTYPLASNIE